MLCYERAHARVCVINCAPLPLATGTRIEELERLNALPLTRWSLEICSAVLSLHDASVAHRDLKLENFVLRDDNSLCLVDFGVSAVYHKRTGGLLTAGSSATLVGSTFYAAPELMRRAPSKRSTQPTSLMATTTMTTTTTSSSAVTLLSSSLSTPAPPSVSVSALPATATPYVSGPSHMIDAEQQYDERDAAFAADRWALGVLLLELCSGHVFQMHRNRPTLGQLALGALDAGAWHDTRTLFCAGVVPACCRCCTRCLRSCPPSVRYCHLCAARHASYHRPRDLLSCSSPTRIAYHRH